MVEILLLASPGIQNEYVKEISFPADPNPPYRAPPGRQKLLLEPQALETHSYSQDVMTHCRDRLAKVLIEAD